MIRCMPIDGSPPFEVEDWVGVAQIYPDRDYGITIGASLAASCQGYERISLRVCGQMCRIESWRERAERLERELAELRQKIALGAMDKRSESEHG